MTLSPAIPAIDESELKFVEVKRGDVDINLGVYGNFASVYERLISAPVNGQVSEVLIRNGASVEAGSIIARLTNPDLLQEQQVAETKLEQMQSEYKVAELAKQNEELAFKANIADLTSQLEKLELDIDVYRRLLAEGITAKLDLEKAMLSLNLLNKQLEFSKFRLLKMQEMHKLELEQLSILLGQQNKHNQLLAKKVSDLEIKAGIAGTIQKLDIEVGQRVTHGEAMAKVGSREQLLAKLQIPQRVAKTIGIGNKVTVSHEGQKLVASISQLSSVVENGFVSAEANFIEALPTDIRPEQPLKAHVYIRNESGALYLTQQPGFKPLSKQKFFIKDEGNLKRVEVTFGELTGSTLLVSSGLKAGEQLVVNNLNQWVEYPTLNINSSSMF